MAMSARHLAECARGGLRLRPSFLIIGAAKAGTTSLYGAMKTHPDVCMPRVKEINYFSAHYERGPRWYARQFPLRWKADRADAATGEASPAYLGVPECAGRIRAYFGESVRLVAILRNPVERAWSQYWHRCRLQLEPLSFEDAIAREMARPGGVTGTDWYLGGGHYAMLLERYLEHVPRSMLHVMFSEELAARPQAELDSLAGFLGLTPGRMSLPQLNVGTYPPLPSLQRRELEAHFDRPNAALARLLDRPLPW